LSMAGTHRTGHGPGPPEWTRRGGVLTNAGARGTPPLGATALAHALPYRQVLPVPCSRSDALLRRATFLAPSDSAHGELLLLHELEPGVHFAVTHPDGGGLCGGDMDRNE